PMKPIFRDSMGKLITQPLLLETRDNLDYAIYTTGYEDHLYTAPDGRLILYPSLYKIYMQIADITEYEFATKCFESWHHFQRVRENNLFTNMFNSWQDELEVKLRSDAIRCMRAHAKTDKGAASAKWLAERGW